LHSLASSGILDEIMKRQDSISAPGSLLLAIVSFTMLYAGFNFVAGYIESHKPVAVSKIAWTRTRGGTDVSFLMRNNTKHAVTVDIFIDARYSDIPGGGRGGAGGIGTYLPEGIKGTQYLIQKISIVSPELGG
jgi:hypothetical protein